MVSVQALGFEAKNTKSLLHSAASLDENTKNVDTPESSLKEREIHKVVQAGYAFLCCVICILIAKNRR